MTKLKFSFGKMVKIIPSEDSERDEEYNIEFYKNAVGTVINYSKYQYSDEKIEHEFLIKLNDDESKEFHQDNLKCM